MAKKKRISQKVIRRSPCPLACSLDIWGDKWTLLVIRDLYYGRSRFKELVLAPEGPPTNIVAERLKRLLGVGLIKKIESSDGTKHRAYCLTEKGRALLPVLEAAREWGLQWLPATEARINPLSWS